MTEFWRRWRLTLADFLRDCDLPAMIHSRILQAGALFTMLAIPYILAQGFGLHHVRCSS
jgi:D-alanyl-lipoteichoic acid acyltransferase DltB (MBOAT superfamily)